MGPLKSNLNDFFINCDTDWFLYCLEEWAVIKSEQHMDAAPVSDPGDDRNEGKM